MYLFDHDHSSVSLQGVHLHLELFDLHSLSEGRTNCIHLYGSRPHTRRTG